MILRWTNICQRFYFSSLANNRLMLRIKGQRKANLVRLNIPRKQIMTKVDQNHEAIINSILKKQLNKLQYYVRNGVVLSEKNEQHFLEKLKDMMNFNFNAVIQQNLQLIETILEQISKVSSNPDVKIILQNVKTFVNPKQHTKKIDKKLSTVKQIEKKIRKKEEIIEQIIEAEPILQLNKEEYENINNSLFFLYSLCSKPFPSERDQTKRIFILKLIKPKISSLNIDQLSNIAKYLNNMSHYDFLEEQLQIVKEIFEKLQERINEIDEETIDSIFSEKQNNSNTINLSQFHRKIIKKILPTIKRYDSISSQTLFKLIFHSYYKLKPNGVLDSEDLPIQQFLLKFITISGKTKKHNESINKVLEKIIPQWLSAKSILILINILEVNAKFKCSPLLLFEIATKGIEIHTLINFRETQNLNLILSLDKCTQEEILLMLIVSYHSTKLQKVRLHLKNHVNRYFQSLQLFSKLLDTITLIHAPKMFLAFNKIFVEEVKRLYQSCIPFSKRTDQLIFLRYFTLTLNKTSEKQLKIYRKYIKTVSKQAFIYLLQQWLNSTSKIQTENILILLSQINQVWFQSQTIQIFQIINKFLRSNHLNIVEKTYFYNILIDLIKTDHSNLKDSKIEIRYYRFISNLLKNYNKNSQTFMKTGYHINLLRTLSNYIHKFSKFPRLQQIIFQNCFNHMIITKGITQFIKTTHNKSNMSQIDIQKINHILYPSNIPSIEDINYQSLKLILYNKNLHHLLKDKNQKILSIINQSNQQQLYYLIIHINEQMNNNTTDTYTTIFKQFMNKKNYLAVNMYLILKTIQKFNLHSTPAGEQFIRKYFDYLIDSNQIIQDYKTSLLLFNLMSTIPHFSDQLERYFKKLKDAAKYLPQALKAEIWVKGIFTSYQFSTDDLNIFLEYSHHWKTPYFFFLEQAFTLYQRQKILLKMIQQITQQPAEIQQVVNDVQYFYLKQKYPKQTASLNLNIDLLTKGEAISLSQKVLLQKIIKMASYFGETVHQVAFLDYKLYKIRDSVLLFLHRYKQNRKYEISFLQRLIKVKFGSNINACFIFSFHNSFQKLQECFKLNRIFTNKEWQKYFDHIKEQIAEQQQKAKNLQNEKKQ